MTLFGPDDLVGFVALAGQQHGGLVIRRQDGGADGFAAVGDEQAP